MIANWKNRGSLAGFIKKNSLSGLDYDLPQSIKIDVLQKDNILFHQQIDDVDSTGKFFSIDYEFFTVEDNIVIVFSNDHNPPQFNLDNSIEISNIILDDLFDIPKISYMGMMKNQDGTINNTNSLFGTGTLTYTLSLPVTKMIFAT